VKGNGCHSVSVGKLQGRFIEFKFFINILLFLKGRHAGKGIHLLVDSTHLTVWSGWPLSTRWLMWYLSTFRD